MEAIHSKSMRLHPCAVAVAIVASATGSQASLLTWAPGGAGGGAGNWDITSPNWNGGTQVWSNTTPPNDAIFGGPSGAVTLTAPISVGNITFNTSGYTLSGSQLTLAGTGGSTFSTGAGITATINSTLTGGGALIKSGAGTLTLAGAQTYTGATTVNAGRLLLSNPTGFVSATTVNSGATLSFTGTTTVTVAAPVTLNNGATLESINPSAGTVLTGAVTTSGNTSITINQTSGRGRELYLDGGLKGSGTVTVNAVNAINALVLRNNNTTFAGTLVINGIASSTAGVGSGLALGGAPTSNALINADVVLNGTIELADQGMGSGFSTSLFNLGALSGTGIMVANRNPTGNFGSTLVLGNTNGSGLFSGQIVRGSGRTNVVGVTKVGTGTQIFSGANSYTGITNVNVGVLNIRNNAALGSTAAGTNVASGAALQIEGGIAVGAEALTLNGTGIANDGALRNMSGVNSYGGAITLGSATVRINSDSGMLTLGALTGATRNLTVGGAGGTTITGDIGITSGTLTKDGSGTAILSGTNTYTGATIIQGGTLRAGAAAGQRAFGTLSAVTLADVAGAALDLNGFSQTIGSLGGGGATGGNVTLGSGTLTTGGNGASTSFGGAISGTGAVVKVGPGTQILAGTSTYTGGTTITAGTLQLGDGGATGSIVGPVLNNAALVVNRSNELSLAGPISGTGTLTQSGSGTTVLTGANTYSGSTNVASGALYVDGNQSAATGATSVASGATLGGRGTIGGAVGLADGATLSPGGAGPAPGTLTVNGDLSLAGGSTLAYSFGQGSVAGGPLNDLTNVGGNLALDGTLDVNTSPGGAFLPGVYRVFNYGGSLADNGLSLGSVPPSTSLFVQTSVAKQVNLVNATNVTLQFWDGAAGPKNSRTVDGGNGVWHVAGSDDNWTESDGAINAPYSNGAFAVFQGAPGTVAVDNTLGQVRASGMQFAVDGYVVGGQPITLLETTPGSGATTLRVGDGTTVGAGYTTTIGSVLQGATRLEKSDLGTLVLAGNNTYTGGTAVNGGTLQVAADANLGAAAGALALDTGTLATTATFSSSRATTLGAGGGTFDVAPDTTLTMGGVIGGAGGLTKTNRGTLVLTADNSYAGGTTITAGTLQIGNGGTTGKLGTGDVINNATLAFNRSDTWTYGGAISGTGELRQAGTGTTVLTGLNTYAGPTTVASGALKAGAADVFSAHSAHAVAPGALLDTGGFNQRVAALDNGGTVSLVGAVAGSTLTVTGPYTAHSLLRLGTTLAGSNSVSDRLVLDGPTATASGSTTIQITNLGGLGALTSGNGIEVVSGINGATTTAQSTKSAFSLAGGHVDAGAFEYRLYAADENGAGENWYLRSTTPAQPSPAAPASAPVPTYRAEVPLLAALPAQLRQTDLAMLGNMHRRMGDEADVRTAPSSSAAGRRAWARAVYSDLNIRQDGIAQAQSDGHVAGLQAGTDLWADGPWQAGLYVGYLDGRADVAGNARGVHARVGRDDLRSRYLGAYATWTDASGLYVDSVLQGGSHRITVRPDANPSLSGKATSVTGSVEVGKPFALDERWSLEPQAQLGYMHSSIDDTALSGAIVDHKPGSGWIARLGARLKGDLRTGAGRLQPYARVNLYWTDFGDDRTRFVGPSRSAAATTTLTGGASYRAAELAAGATLALTPSTSVYGEAGYLWDIGGQADVKSSIQASIGMRVRW